MTNKKMIASVEQVEPRILVQAVKRNIERFREDFMFQLNTEEFTNLKSKFGFQVEAGYKWLPTHLLNNVCQCPPASHSKRKEYPSTHVL